MNKRFLPFIISGVMALLATGAFYGILQDQRRRLDREFQAKTKKLLENYRDPVDVIVAKADIKEGDKITPELLTVKAVPPKFIQPYATARAGDLVGQVAIAPIAKDEQVMRSKLRRANELPASAKLSGVTPEEKRAVTIGTDALTGVGGFVRPGDTVDVLWTVKLPENQGGETVTMTLFQEVSVLAVGNDMVGQPARAQQASGSNYAVTLALGPQEASLLLYAREQGRIQLALRSNSDAGKRAAVTPANSTTLLRTVLGEQALAPPPPRSHTVEVIKGLERSVVAVNPE